MARPTNKDELLASEASGYQRLADLIDVLPPDRLTADFPFDGRDRCVADVVNHLHAWQQLMLDWYRTGMAGDRPVMPAPGYTWKTTPDLNRAIWERSQGIALPTARDQLSQSRRKLLRIIDRHSDEELFTKQRYPWTGTTSLGAYLISATSSHYDWAIKKLRKAQRAWAATG